MTEHHLAYLKRVLNNLQSDCADRLSDKSLRAMYIEDLSYTLEVIDELSGVISDLMQDQPAYQRGYDQAVVRLRDVLVSLRQQLVKQRHSFGNPLITPEELLRTISDQMISLDHLDRNLLPPAQVRAENERLRALLEEVQQACSGPADPAHPVDRLAKVRIVLSKHSFW